MSFQEHDVVQLRHELTEHGLGIGTEGTVVMVYDADPPEYEVEFFDGEGTTLAVLTVKASDLEQLNRGAPHVPLPAR
jgi:hypothetical protein